MGGQEPVGTDAEDLIPTVKNAQDYFAIVNHQGRPTLCKFDQRANQWRIINEGDMQRMIQAAGGSSDLMRQLF